MRTKSIILLAIVLPSVCLAESIDFYTDGVIQDGNTYLDVRVFDNATVNMTGGKVGREFDTYESSTVNLSNGSVSVFQIFDISTINISGGIVGDLNVYGSGIANLTGGQITGHLAIWDPAKVNIYGYGFEFTTEGNIYLSGYWGSGMFFNIWLRGPETPSHVVLHVIPEPATFFLLVLGLGILRKRV